MEPKPYTQTSSAKEASKPVQNAGFGCDVPVCVEVAAPPQLTDAERAFLDYLITAEVNECMRKR